MTASSVSRTLASGRRSFSEEDADFAALAGAGDLRCRSAVGDDLQIAHAAEDPEDFSGCSFGIG